MFKSKKTTILMSALLVLTLFLTACGGGGATSSNELVVAQGADPKSLDPHASNDQPSTRVSRNIYDRLVEADSDMNIVPGLAEEWSQDESDPTVWTFKIREGVKFHNGEELTPQDVKFTLERMKNSSEVGHIIGSVDTIEVDGQNVIVKTTEPFAPLLAHLTHPASSILNEKAVTEGGEDYAANPVGTGPFKYVDFVPSDYVELAKNEDYWGEAAKVDKLTFKPITEGANRRIGLETGEIDIAYDIEPVDRKEIGENKDLELAQDASLSTAYIGFNTQKAPYDDIRVRQAINYAVNVDDVIRNALEGSGVVATGPINDKVFGYNPNLTAYEYNPEKAKELLKEAGLENGFSTSIWLNDTPVRIKIAETVQSQLQEIGIDVSIEQMEWAAYLDKTASGEHDMYSLSWTTVTGDADYGLYPLFHSSQHGGAGNRAFYSNPEVDRLLELGRTSTSEEERIDAYGKIQEIIVEEAPQIFLYFDNQNVGMSSKLEGFVLNPAGNHDLSTVSKGASEAK